MKVGGWMSGRFGVGGLLGGCFMDLWEPVNVGLCIHEYVYIDGWVCRECVYERDRESEIHALVRAHTHTRLLTFRLLYYILIYWLWWAQLLRCIGVRDVTPVCDVTHVCVT